MKKETEMKNYFFSKNSELEIISFQELTSLSECCEIRWQIKATIINVAYTGWSKIYKGITTARQIIYEITAKTMLNFLILLRKRICFSFDSSLNFTPLLYKRGFNNASKKENI